MDFRILGWNRLPSAIMRKTKPIRECMSRLPEEIDRRESLSSAVAMMRKQRCHHVPVMDGPRIYGVLSSYDLQELVIKGASGLDGLSAGDVCTTEPLTVEPMAPVYEVAQAMLERKVSSALVADGGVLVGIFTATDALRLIAAL